MLGYELIVILVMLCFNAILAAYEMGLASISKARLNMLASENKKGTQEALFMKDRMEASLAIIQLGITLVGAFAAATGGAGFAEKFTPFFMESLNIPRFSAEILAVIFLIIPLTFITIIFAELVPKMLALNNKEWVVLRLSPFMKSLSRMAGPIIFIIEAIVKKTVRAIMGLRPKRADDKTHSLHEFKAAVSLARASKLLGTREEKIVLSSVFFSTRAVRDIIIPAQDISMIWMNDSLMDALIKAHMDMHTRFPVSFNKDDPQSIEGYVNFKDIVTAIKTNPSEPSVRAITRPIRKIKADTSISQTLETMIQEKIHIAIVVSGDGMISGMVTLEDILEELVGEIEDEFDRLPTHIHPCGSSWIMGGGVPMATVFSTVGLKVEDGFKNSKAPTLNEWCQQRSAHPLQGGETIEADSIRVVPRKFRRKKISEASVSLLKD